MNKRYYFPSRFLDNITDVHSLHDIARAVGCSETTAYNNLEELVKEGKIKKEWNNGRWLYSNQKQEVANNG